MIDLRYDSESNEMRILCNRCHKPVVKHMTVLFIAQDGDIAALHKNTCDPQRGDDGWFELDDQFYKMLERGIAQDRPTISNDDE